MGFDHLLLFVAGWIGGIANAIAGGATLITFPAMVAAGLPPLIANASNAVAVSPAHLVAAVADFRELPVRRVWMRMLGASVLGGTLGALLLLLTPERLFNAFVPLLVGLATAAFAFGHQLRAHLQPVPQSRYWLLALTSIYGGYSGGGLGVMLLAVLFSTGPESPREANVLKNVLATGVSVTAIVIFVASGLVSWPETLIVLGGAILGGLSGSWLAAVLPAPVVRAAIIAIGCAMTAIFAWRYWLA